MVKHSGHTPLSTHQSPRSTCGRPRPSRPEQWVCDPITAHSDFSRRDWHFPAGYSAIATTRKRGRKRATRVYQSPLHVGEVSYLRFHGTQMGVENWDMAHFRSRGCRAVDGAPVPFRNVVPAAIACHALGLPLPGLSGWAWRLCSALESAREWMFGLERGRVRDLSDLRLW